jgi:hypothetical protein
MRRHPGVSRVNRSATPDEDTQPAGWTQTSSAPGNDRRTSRSPSSRVRTQRPRYATPATRDILRPEWMTQPDLSGTFTRLSGLQLLLSVPSYSMALTATLPMRRSEISDLGTAGSWTARRNDTDRRRHNHAANSPVHTKVLHRLGDDTARHQRPITGERNLHLPGRCRGCLPRSPEGDVMALSGAPRGGAALGISSFREAMTARTPRPAQASAQGRLDASDPISWTPR